MRGLVREFAERGGTVLLSSHLLSEVQATVDHLVVIAGGSVAAAGPLQDLLATAGVVVRSPQPELLLRMLGMVHASYSLNPDHSVTVDSTIGDLDLERIGYLALQHGVPLSELRKSDATGLEDLFFSLTSNPNTVERAA
ncbi:MAG: ABC transporter ATP-binding protein, partial [Actinobacteria bacterium]|nr:ABC transporter ATP-binding protein [Actinomycetota bacterium]